MDLKTPRVWQESPKIAARLLWPLSQIYRLGYLLHQWYQRLKVKKVGVPIIAVGNHLVGGSGKTPTTIMLAKLASELQIKAHIVTRGYKGSIQGPYLVQENDNPKHVGDEALLLARAAPTWVSKRRILGAEEAVKQGAELIILDDGMHHNSIHRDCNILVLDKSIKCNNSYLLPAGPLRESLHSALSRSNMVIVLNGSLRNETPATTLLADTILDFEPKPGAKYLAFTGIAYPEKFKLALAKAGATDIELYPFPDHHFYNEEELQNLSNAAKAKGALLVTTAKDYVKLSPPWQQQVTVVNMRLELLQDGLTFIRSKLLKLSGK